MDKAQKAKIKAQKANNKKIKKEWKAKTKAQKIKNKNIKKAQAKKSGNRNKFLIPIIIVVAVLILVLGLILFLLSERKKDDSDSYSQADSSHSVSEASDESRSSATDDIESEIPQIQPIDADEYLDEIGEVLEKYDAKTSDKAFSENDVMKQLKDKGFDQNDIETNYSINGEYKDAEQISGGSEVHPMYETYFVSSSGVIWLIEIVADTISAEPITYTFQENQSRRIIFSESNSLMFYDNVTNRFFEVIPDETTAVIKQFDKIDAELLESFTIEELDKL